ncbi:MAG: DUF3108 domain-containing protein [Gemmobacter sp.]
MPASPRRRFRLSLLALVACLAAMTALVALSPAGHAQQVDNHTFDVTLKGLRAATLSFAGEQSGNAYSVSGKLESRGLAAMVRKVRYDATARGSARGGKYTPSAYSEKADTGKRKSASVMEYRRGVPQVKSYDPPREPRPEDLDPARQGGTVDPLTALYATLRDVEAGQECKVALQMFDGRRRTQIALTGRKAEGETVSCRGEYRRIAGYSAEDMAEKTRFPFVLTYAPKGDGRMQVQTITTETLYGTATLTRR